MITILYGNGFNLLNNRAKWEKLVHTIDDSKDFDKDGYKYRIPNTLQYEVKSLFARKEKMVKVNIASKMKSYKSNSLFDELLSLDVNHFLTTNYDYVADEVFKRLKYKEDKKDYHDKTESLYSIHRRKCYSNSSQEKFLWRIHGELSNHNSIMLGYDHYCSYVGHIKKYKSGEYNFGLRKRKYPDPIPKIELRLGEPNFEIISWIDLFFVSDLYIIGFGLYYDEIDIWWILTMRKRLMKKLGKGVINNKLVFYGECAPGKKKLLERLGVEVYIPASTGFPDQYREFIDDIKNVRIPAHTRSFSKKRTITNFICPPLPPNKSLYPWSNPCVMSRIE